MANDIEHKESRMPIRRDGRRDDQEERQEAGGDGERQGAAAHDGEPPRVERRVARRAHEAVDVVLNNAVDDERHQERRRVHRRRRVPAHAKVVVSGAVLPRVALDDTGVVEVSDGPHGGEGQGQRLGRGRDLRLRRDDRGRLLGTKARDRREDREYRRASEAANRVGC